MPYSRRACCALSAASVAGFVIATLFLTGSVSNAQSNSEPKKPSLSLRVTPPVGFAPLKPAEFVIIKLQQMAGQIQT